MENEEIEAVQEDWVEIKAQLRKNEKSVLIKDFFFTDPAVFPPSNHEGLPISSPNQAGITEGTSQLFLSSASGDHNGEDREGEPGSKDAGWKRIRLLGFLTSSGFGKVVSRMRNIGAVCRAGMRHFAWAATGLGALALVVVLWRRAAERWRRQVQPESRRHHLMLLIESKDQKINELLHQITQLHDSLSAQRRVPVIQVG